jgi:WD40 repeat protein
MSASEQSVLVAESQISSGSDGCWSEAVSKGEIRCLQTVGEQLFSGSTNVRVWDLRTGLNTHSIPMKPRTSVKDMVLQQQEGRTSVWCAHSDGRVSEIVVDPGSFEPELDRQFSAHRSAVSTILVTPELEIWTGSSRGTIRCWSIEEIASVPPVRTTKLGCPFYEPMVAVELEWQGSRGSDVRCLLSVPSEGTVWSGSSGKGGTHV